MKGSIEEAKQRAMRTDFYGTPGDPGPQPEPSKDTFKGGATRNHLPYRYDLIQPHFLDELGEALEEGAARHDPRNWEKADGDPVFRDATINHIWNHWILWLKGDRSEPHLGKMVFGIMCLKFFEAKNGERYESEVKAVFNNAKAL